MNFRKDTPRKGSVDARDRAAIRLGQVLVLFTTTGED